MQQLAESPPQRQPPLSPYGLVSLWDMHVFQAPHLMSLAQSLSKLQAYMDTPPAQWNALLGGRPPDDRSPATRAFLVGLRKACEDADLSISAGVVFEHIALPPTTSEAMGVLFTCVVTEMKQRAYFRMPQEKVPYWNKKDLLSPAANTAFGEQATMLETASTCYSYGLPVACVFHAMQAVETGLRVVADKLGAPMTGHENMKTVIEAIEKKSGEIEKLPIKTNPNKVADAQFYGEIATNASNFKNAWRNYVAHGKAPYTDQQAFDVLHDVRRFFDKLAERFSADDVEKANARAVALAAQPS